MQSKLAHVFPSRHSGFSLVEVALAIALLGLATAVSLPRFNHLANRAPPAEALTNSSKPSNVTQTAVSRHSASGSDFSVSLVTGKIFKLMSGYPDTSTNGGTLFIDWGGFATIADPDLHTLPKADAASVSNCSEAHRASEKPGSAAKATTLGSGTC